MRERDKGGERGGEVIKGMRECERDEEGVREGVLTIQSDCTAGS